MFRNCHHQCLLTKWRYICGIKVTNLFSVNNTFGDLFPFLPRNMREFIQLRHNESSSTCISNAVLGYSRYFSSKSFKHVLEIPDGFFAHLQFCFTVNSFAIYDWYFSNISSNFFNFI